jgi:RND family efflux transporter MFP subunit
MNKQTRNIALGIIVIVGCIGFGYVWMTYSSNPNPKEAPAVSEGTTGAILLDGTVVPEKSAQLGFVVPAAIISITKKVGDEVKSGEILATQDNSDLKAQLSAARASVAGAESELDVLKHDLKVEKLKLHGLSGNARKQQDAQISSSKDSLEVQASAIVAAQDNANSVAAGLAKTILKAPFDGIITRQDGEIGEVGGSSVPPFMTIASNEPPQKIEAFASDLDVVKIKTDDVAQITFDILGNQKTIPAKVISVDPSTDESNGKATYKITLMLENTDAGIKSGMHASVSF